MPREHHIFIDRPWEAPHRQRKQSCRCHRLLIRVQNPGKIERKTKTTFPRPHCQHRWLRKLHMSQQSVHNQILAVIRMSTSRFIEKLWQRWGLLDGLRPKTTSIFQREGAWNMVMNVRVHRLCAVFSGMTMLSRLMHIVRELWQGWCTHIDRQNLWCAISSKCCIQRDTTIQDSYGYTSIQHSYTMM